MLKDFRLIVKSELKEKSLKITPLAKKLGISPINFFYAVRGNTEPQLKTVYKILDYFGYELIIKKRVK
jgi:DNA-binding phage protein